MQYLIPLGIAFIVNASPLRNSAEVQILINITGG